MHTERGRRPRSDFAGKDGKERGRSRWEPPASAGGATLQRRGKSRTSINRALAPVSLGRCVTSALEYCLRPKKFALFTSCNVGEKIPKPRG